MEFKRKAERIANLAENAESMSKLLIKSDDETFMNLYQQVQDAVMDISQTTLGEFPLNSTHHESSEDGESSEPIASCSGTDRMPTLTCAVNERVCSQENDDMPSVISVVDDDNDMGSTWTRKSSERECQSETESQLGTMEIPVDEDGDHDHDNDDCEDDNLNNDGTVPWERVFQFGREGKETECFKFARAVSISPTNGDITIADYCNKKVGIYTSTGKLKHLLKSQNRNRRKGKGKGLFLNAQDVSYSSSGNLFVVDRSKHVQVFSGGGDFTNMFAVRKDSNPPTRLSCIAIEQKKVDNCIYVGDCEPSKSCVHVLTEDGKYIRTVKVSIPPVFLAVKNEGQVLVTGDENPTVLSVQMSQRQVEDLAQQTFPIKDAYKVAGVAWDNETQGFYVAVREKKQGKGRVDLYSFSGDFVKNVIGPGLLNSLGLALSSTLPALVVADMYEIKYCNPRDLNQFYNMF